MFSSSVSFNGCYVPYSLTEFAKYLRAYFYQSVFGCNWGSSVSVRRQTAFLNDSCKTFIFWEELLLPRCVSLWRNRLARSSVNRNVDGSNKVRDVLRSDLATENHFGKQNPNMQYVTIF